MFRAAVVEHRAMHIYSGTGVVLGSNIHHSISERIVISFTHHYWSGTLHYTFIYHCTYVSRAIGLASCCALSLAKATHFHLWGIRAHLYIVVSTI